MFGDHDGVNDEGEEEAGRLKGDGFDHFGRAEGAGFGGLGREVFGDSVELGNGESGSEDFHGFDADGVLDGEQREDRGAVDAVLVEGFQVRLDAGAAAGVRNRRW